MSIYQVNKITESLYSIKEDITDNKFPIFIYLVLGTQKAALIDTGIGSGDLKKTVEQITKLPIIVLHTHGHGDHVGADTLFKQVYLNHRDINMVDNNDIKIAEKQRINFIKQHLKDKPFIYEKIKKHIVKSGKVNYKDIDDGDMIDLGGVKLEAISTPGHTLGCVSYVNKKDCYAFTGDGIADIHWFDTEESISVQEFLNTLQHFEQRAEGIKNIYAAHISQPFSLKLIHDLQTAAKAVIGGVDDKIENANYQFLIHGDLYAHQEGEATIYYSKEKIYSTISV